MLCTGTRASPASVQAASKERDVSQLEAMGHHIAVGDGKMSECGGFGDIENNIPEGVPSVA